MLEQKTSHKLHISNTGTTHWVRQVRRPPYQNFFESRRFIGENGKKKFFFQVNILLNDITRSLTSLFDFVPCAIETVDYTSRCSIYNINGGKKESAARYIIIKEIALWKGLF